MKRLVMSMLVFACLTGGAVLAQDAAPAAEAAPAVAAEVQPADAASKKNPTGFFAVVFGSGWLGVMLWAALFSCGATAIYFIVDSWVLIRAEDHAADTD